MANGASSVRHFLAAAPTDRIKVYAARTVLANAPIAKFEFGQSRNALTATCEAFV
jgi:hypothetical protein